MPTVHSGRVMTDTVVNEVMECVTIDYLLARSMCHETNHQMIHMCQISWALQLVHMLGQWINFHVHHGQFSSKPPEHNIPPVWMSFLAVPLISCAHLTYTYLDLFPFINSVFSCPAAWCSSLFVMRLHNQLSAI